MSPNNTDIREIRQRNLRQLVAEVGSVALLAEKADTSASWLGALSSPIPQRTAQGTARGIGNELARKLEQGAGKPVGWMDHEQNFTDEQIAWVEKFGQLRVDLQKKGLDYLELLLLKQASDADSDDHD